MKNSQRNASIIKQYLLVEKYKLVNFVEIINPVVYTEVILIHFRNSIIKVTLSFIFVFNDQTAKRAANFYRV